MELIPALCIIVKTVENHLLRKKLKNTKKTCINLLSTPFFGGQNYNEIEAKKLDADAEQEKSKVDDNNWSMYLFISNIY